MSTTTSVFIEKLGKFIQILLSEAKIYTMIKMGPDICW